jgi:hypothetical protein
MANEIMQFPPQSQERIRLFNELEGARKKLAKHPNNWQFKKKLEDAKKAYFEFQIRDGEK